MASQQHTDSRMHSIISYLQRPQLISTFEFAPGKARGTILTDKPLVVPNSLLTKMYLDKLDGFTSFRATAVFQLQLNAQPFQAGRLIMYAVPMPTLVSPREQWISKHVTMTQALHNVQIDISKQTEVTLKVPFVSPFNSYDLIHGEYPWANLYVMVYSELNQVEQANLQCLMFAHFEDIELGAPTSGRAKQQSGVVPQKSDGAPKEISAQVASMLREKESKGVISSISGGAMKAYDTLGKGIPSLSPITSVFSTLSSAASSLFGGILGGLPLLGKLIGLSKPIPSYCGQTVLIRPAEYFGNVDGIDHSHVLSLMALNAVDEYPTLGGTNLEETSMKYLQSIPQYIANFCYGKNTKYNDTLLELFVIPNADVPSTVHYSGANPGPESDITQPTVLKYISSPFAYWTGSLVYTLRFVKTDFHSGRVEISFHPFVSEIDQSRADYVYRLVVDLRENSEVSFTVPYISPTPWKRNGGYNAMSALAGDILSQATGKLRIRALTPLICASPIVGNNIECLVELRAGDDYEVASPSRQSFFPFTLLPDVIAREQAGEVYALPGTSETRTGAIEGSMPTSITGDNSDINRSSSSMFTQGEVFVDFRSLIKRFSFTEKVFAYRDETVIRYPSLLIRPPALFTSQWENNDKDIVSQFSLRANISPLTFVSGMYAFYRGSYRLKVYISESQDPVDLISMRLATTSSLQYSIKSQPPVVNTLISTAFEQPMSKRFAEFQVPYYSPTVCTVPYHQETLNKQETQPNISVMLNTNIPTKDGKPVKASPIYYNLALAAGDDLSFHMFLGVPPCFSPTFVRSTITGTGDSFGNLNYDTLNVDPCYMALEPGSRVNWTYKSEGTSSIVDFIFKDTTSPCAVKPTS